MTSGPTFRTLHNAEPVGVVQILVFQAYMVSLYLHFIAFDFLYVVEFSRSRI